MRARGMPARAQRGPALGRVQSVESVRSRTSKTGKIAKSVGLQAPKSQPTNDDSVFDPKIFLARPGLGKTLLKLKKNETAFAQGDPSDAVFYVQKGRLRVTVTSANGKEATITLVGAEQFLGEDCMVSAHPVRLATATAMTECALLRIDKAEMVRVLQREQKLSETFMTFLLSRNARIQADPVDQLFNSSEKRLARILLLLAQFGKESKLGFIEYSGEIRIHNTLLNIFLQE